MRLSILLVLVLATGLVATSSASAASVCLDAGVATFAAADVGSDCPGGTNGASEVNVLPVSANAGGDIVFSDANQPITDVDGPGGCSVTGGTATCPGALGFRFDLGGGGDSATVGAVANGGLVSTGGAGDDHLVGGPLGDMLDGGAGNDVIQGGGGDDTLTGGDGNDTVDGGDGND